VEDRGRLALLDGWRALSILLVLATHLLPLGPASLRLNETAGPMGMALFFTLSGFLITRMLLTVDVKSFLIRRFFRIVPLAWLATLIVLPFNFATPAEYAAHLLFFMNLPPFWMVEGTGHFWSLCVEMHFYVSIALAVAFFGRRALHFVPLVSLAVTAGRIATGNEISIITWFRIDEIMAGGIVALAFTGHLGKLPAWIASKLNVYWMLPLFAAACHPALGPLNYLRPYFAASLVFVSLATAPRLLHRLSVLRATIWIAEISYALYVIHGILIATWLAEGDTLAKYLKRPLLIALTFGLAHLSTYYYERRWIRFAKQLTSAKPSLSPAN
jgi:peptidoglycan/LPS O-acetylase OafA/YrhL